MARCRLAFGRGSGPGGQHRNKVQTAVRITHESTGVSGEATERRSQQENRRMAIFRLRVNLALEVRHPPPPDGAPPSERWRARSRGGRLAINGGHDDFPALLAEALDVLAVHDEEPSRAGDRLGVSTSQLIKLLKIEPRALEQVNRARAERGLHRLR